MKYLFISTLSILLLTLAESQGNVSYRKDSPCVPAKSYNFKVTLRDGRVIWSYQNKMTCDNKNVVITIIEQRDEDCTYYYKTITVPSTDIEQVEYVDNPAEK